MSYTSAEIITSEQRQVYITAYLDFMQAREEDALAIIDPNSTAIADEIYQAFFRVDGQSGLAGFKILVKDFVMTFNQPGITHWHVSFGYDIAASIPGAGAGFKLIVHGSGADGIVRTSYFSLTEELIHIPFPPLILDPTLEEDLEEIITSCIDFNSRKVPVFLWEIWTQAWKDVITTQKCPLNILQIQLNGNGIKATPILRGYTFQFEHLLSVLNGPGVDQNSEIRCYLVNKGTDTSSTGVQNPIGTLGLILGAFYQEEENILNPLSSFYDFSKPCPPTC